MANIIPEPIKEVSRGVQRVVTLKPKQKKLPKFKSISPKRIKIAPRLSQEQAMLGEMFGGADTFWGTGQNLPQMNQTLTSGHGLIKSDDGGETGSMFGVRRRRW